MFPSFLSHQSALGIVKPYLNSTQFAASKGDVLSFFLPAFLPCYLFSPSSPVCPSSSCIDFAPNNPNHGTLTPFPYLGLPLIMFETNTASCGGFPGLSDAFAAALWGVDYALTMAQVHSSLTRPTYWIMNTKHSTLGRLQRSVVPYRRGGG